MNQSLTEATTLAPRSLANYLGHSYYSPTSGQRAINGVARSAFFPTMPKSALARVPFSLRARRAGLAPLPLDRPTISARRTLTGKVTHTEALTGGRARLDLVDSEGDMVIAVLEVAKVAPAWPLLLGRTVTVLVRVRARDEDLPPDSPDIVDVLRIEAVSR